MWVKYSRLPYGREMGEGGGVVDEGKGVNTEFGS